MGLPEWSWQAETLPKLEDLFNIKDSLEQGRGDFIHHNPLGTPFQVLNKEFIESISNQIISLSEAIDLDNIKVLEVGAGNGRLSYFLNKELTINSIKKKISQIATDNFSWHENDDMIEMWVRKIHGIDVEDLDVKDALEKHKPSIVISSWMPYSKDWTKYFREDENVKGFIMIGNPMECGTLDSWMECDKFTKEQLSLPGNISWQDNVSTWEHDDKTEYSEIYLFKRS